MGSISKRINTYGTPLFPYVYTLLAVIDIVSIFIFVFSRGFEGGFWQDFAPVAVY